MTPSTLAWVTILMLVVTVEAVTLLLAKRGDTLSEKIWALIQSHFLRASFFGLWFWLTWHFIVEPFLVVDLSASVSEDLLIVLLGFLVGWIVPASRWRGSE